MKRSYARRLRSFAFRKVGLAKYLERPGDGRRSPMIAASTLLWAQIVGVILRESSSRAVEALVRSPASKVLGVARHFGDDSLAYFTERLDADRLRRELARILRRAKRNKAFDGSRFIGLALDGTGTARCSESRCALCVPNIDAKGETIGYGHHFSMVTVVGVGLPLPVDIEPYGPGDCESNASQRLIARVVELLGRRFADYAVGDGAYATAPTIHALQDLGLHVVIRLKANLPTLFAAAQKRFEAIPPNEVHQVGGDRVEIWDASDFDPWDNLRWSTVRVFRYRQHRSDGSVCEAYWLTDYRQEHVGALRCYLMAKSRWEVENQGFNDGKNRYGMEHIRHHHANSLIVDWLLTLVAIVIERLFRLRYLHRGNHRPMAAVDLLRLLRLSLGRPYHPGSG